MSKQTLTILVCSILLFFASFSFAEAARDSQEESVHLRSIDAIVYRPQDMKNGRVVSVVATSLDSLNTSLVKEKGAAGTDELARFLQANRAILGDTSNLTFKLQRYGETSKEVTEGLGHSQATLTFVQVVSGLEMPISTISLVNGRPTDVSVKLADQDDPTFDRKNWRSEQSLEAIAKLEMQKLSGRKDVETLRSHGQFRIVETSKGDAFEVVYDFTVGPWLVRLNAVTGLVMQSVSLQESATLECEALPGSPFGAHLNCLDANVFQMFRVDGSCCGSGCGECSATPACNDPVYQAAYDNVQEVEAWADAWRYPGPPNIQIFYKALSLDSPTYDFAWYFPGGGTNYQEAIIGTGASFIAASPETREDAIVHEWGHGWRGSRVQQSLLGSFFQRAMSESIADLVVGFSQGDWFVDLGSGLGRNLNNGTTWANFETEPFYGEYHESSVIISDLFFDIHSVLLNPFESTALFLYVASRAGGGSYTVDTLRQHISNYINNSARMDPSDRDLVCGVWLTKGMPGSVCESMTPTLASSFESCDELPPYSGTFSFYDINWTGGNSSSYECQKRGQGGQWQPVSLGSPGDESVIQVVGQTGSFEYRVRGCEGQDCGDYSNIVTITPDESCDDCGDPLAKSDGVGLHEYDYVIENQTPRDLEITFEAYFIPDGLTVKANGYTLASTSGLTSGKLKQTVAYNPAIHGNTLDVTVDAPNPGTSWQLCIDCPGGDCEDSFLPIETVVRDYNFQPPPAFWTCGITQWKIDGIPVSSSGINVPFTVGPHEFSYDGICVCDLANEQTCASYAPRVSVQGHSLHLFSGSNSVILNIN